MQHTSLVAIFSCLFSSVCLCDQFTVLVTETDITKLPSQQLVSVVDHRTAETMEVTLSDSFELLIDKESEFRRPATSRSKAKSLKSSEHESTADSDHDSLLYCRLPLSLSLESIDMKREEAIVNTDMEALQLAVFADFGRSCIRGLHKTADVGPAAVPYTFCPRQNISRLVTMTEDESLQTGSAQGSNASRIQTLGRYSPDDTRIRWSHTHHAFEMYYLGGDACRSVRQGSPANSVPYVEREDQQVFTRIILRCASRLESRKMLWALNFIHSECAFQIEMGMESVCSAIAAINDGPERNAIVCNRL
jgi:hypothetical protein